MIISNLNSYFILKNNLFREKIKKNKLYFFSICPDYSKNSSPVDIISQVWSAKSLTVA